MGSTSPPPIGNWRSLDGQGTQPQWQHSTCCQHSRTSPAQTGSSQRGTPSHPGSTCPPPPRSPVGPACGSPPLLARCRRTSPSSRSGAAAGSLLFGSSRPARPDFHRSSQQVLQHTASCSRSRTWHIALLYFFVFWVAQYRNKNGRGHQVGRLTIKVPIGHGATSCRAQGPSHATLSIGESQEAKDCKECFHLERSGASSTKAVSTNWQR